ncbi:MAG: hypothetical protein KAI73_00030 [Rhodospirillaceae bacterium]|nr:hypothetical protein [Rhodospirillaceae bacterium]
MSDQQFPWGQHVENIRARGVLGMQLYVVETTPTDGLGPVLDNLQEHLAYQKMLEETGVMFAAGPFADDDETEWSGAGMVVVRADSVKQAREIAAADPMHSSGARTFRVRPWLLNEGQINISVSYSNGKREIS